MKKIRAFLRDKSKKGHNRQLIASLIVALLATVVFAQFPDLWGDVEATERLRSTVPGIFSSFFGGILVVWFSLRGDRLIENNLKKLEWITFGVLVGLVIILECAATFLEVKVWPFWSIIISIGLAILISFFLAICERSMRKEEAAETNAKSVSTYLITFEKTDELDSVEANHINTYLMTCERIIEKEELDAIEDQQK